MVKNFNKEKILLQSRSVFLQGALLKNEFRLINLILIKNLFQKKKILIIFKKKKYHCICMY